MTTIDMQHRVLIITIAQINYSLSMAQRPVSSLSEVHSVIVTLERHEMSNSCRHKCNGPSSLPLRVKIEIPTHLDQQGYIMVLYKASRVAD